MPKGYQQLTYEKRYTLYALKAIGLSHRKIAKTLGVSSRTVDREILRNTQAQAYDPEIAQTQAEQKRRKPKPHLKKMTPTLQKWIDEKLTQHQWSPEQMAGRLKQNDGISISHETLYQYIWQDKATGGLLYLNLRRHGKTYHKRGSNGKTSRGQIKNRVDIEMRPAIVEARTRLGDWEADTIIGKNHQGAVVTLVDRTSRMTCLVKVERRTAEAVKMAIIEALRDLEVHTITFDNGKEFAYHTEIAEALGVETYFAKPYHSWERGTNENTNGLIRQYLQKSSSFANVGEAELARIAYLLNNRPRKCLNFKTPWEVQHAVA
jgi:IS30 family transposase